MEEDAETSDDTANYHGHRFIILNLEKAGGSMEDSMVAEATKRFMEEIRKSDIYRDYDFQKNRIKQHPELFAKVQEYRRKNYELQTGAQGDELFDKMEAFEKEHEKLRENPLVDGFLRAEVALCRMVQEIYVQITASLDFE